MEGDRKKKIILLFVLGILVGVAVLGFFKKSRWYHLYQAKSQLEKAATKAEKINIFDFEIKLTSAYSPYSLISQAKGRVDLPNKFKVNILEGREIILVNETVYAKTEKDQKWFKSSNASFALKLIPKPVQFLDCFFEPAKLTKEHYRGGVDLSKCASLFFDLNSFLKIQGQPKSQEAWLQNGLPSKILFEFKEDSVLLMILAINFTYPEKTEIEPPEKERQVEEGVLKEIKERDQKRKQDLEMLKAALERYITPQSYFPLSPSWENITEVPNFIDALPKDPLEPDYFYSYQSLDGSTFSLRSFLENKADLLAKREGDRFIYEIKGALQGGTSEPSGLYPY